MTNEEKIKFAKEFVDLLSTHGSARHRVLLDVIKLAERGAASPTQDELDRCWETIKGKKNCSYEGQ